MSRVPTRVRPAIPTDVAGLVALVRTVDPSAGTFSGRPMVDSSEEHLAQRLAEILDEGNRSLLVATDDTSGVLVGLLVAKRDEIGAIDLTPALHVTHLLVEPGHRRRGVGRMLLAAAVQLADHEGLDHVLATVASGSREANRYLARIGFAPMVVQRVAPTSLLRRSLGMAEASERTALLRRARLARRRHPLAGPITPAASARVPRGA